MIYHQYWELYIDIANYIIYKSVCHKICLFGLVYLFDCISTHDVLFNAEIWIICKCWITLITIFSMFHCILFCLYTDIYQVFLSNSNNLYTITWFKIIIPIQIWTSGICTTQNLSWRMRHTNFSGILRYRQLT